MDQESRQNKASEPQLNVRNNGRITRGHSDLPKQQPKPQSESESEEEELSESTPKVKKIHHMTLKKLERLQKLAEMERQGLIKTEPKVEKLPPRKRGRPKGVTKKPVVPPPMEVESLPQPLSERSLEKSQKKEVVLRKRENPKKMIEEPSEQIVEEKPALKPIEIEIIMPQRSVVKAQEVAVVPATPAPPGPKKRGRKKKVQPEVQPVAVAVTQNVAAKVFTIPKAQTYDNYNMFYNRLMMETKESEEKQVPLIFDMFSEPDGYREMLEFVGKSKP